MVECVFGVLHRLNGERGQALGEYSLILAFVAMACVVALGALGVAVADPIDTLAAVFP